jgi:guanosine-3',5'-bis(diphosphate) 3'-pyrophosphohydrolase
LASVVHTKRAINRPLLPGVQSGDRIVGIVTTVKGVTIHTTDCEALESFADAPERWIDVALNNVADGEAPIHVGHIDVMLGNEPGSLGSLTTIIGKNGGNITNLKITNRSRDFFRDPWSTPRCKT